MYRIASKILIIQEKKMNQNQYSVHEIFDIAKQIEKNGYAFYEKAITLSESQDLKDFFSYLKQEESKHLVTFEQIESKLSSEELDGSIWDWENAAHKYLAAIASSHVFNMNKDINDYLKEVTNIDQVFELALRFEKDTVIYFSNLRDCVKSEEHKNAVQELVDEEKKHILSLTEKLAEIKK